MFYRKFIALAVTAAFAFSAGAADFKDYSRYRGLFSEVSIGVPASFEIGAGYQFNTHFAMTAEAFSYSGLTAMTGAVSSKYYMYDRVFTPYAQAKLGYGTLGVDYENMEYNDMFCSVSIGLSWCSFDLGAGFVLDSFHRVGFNTSLSWIYRFGRR